ncbi:hypothetical protein D9M68_744640 [compost metagenome]
MALQHLGKPAHGLGELGEVGAAVGVELDLGEHLGVEADLAPVQQGHLAADHPLVLQPLDAPPAGRLRQPDPLGDLGGGQAGVLLQQLENAFVVGIQSDGHKNSRFR